MGKAQHRTNGALPLPPGRSILTDLEWETLKSALKLTRRQIQIAMGIMDDHTKQRIALDLRLSPHTVDMHTRMLYARLGVSSRVQLVMRLLLEVRNCYSLTSARSICRASGSADCAVARAL